MSGDRNAIRRSLKRLWRDAVDRQQWDLAGMYENAMGRMIDEKIEELIAAMVRNGIGALARKRGGN